MFFRHGQHIDSGNTRLDKNGFYCFCRRRVENDQHAKDHKLGKEGFNRHESGSRHLVEHDQDAGILGNGKMQEGQGSISKYHCSKLCLIGYR